MRAVKVKTSHIQSVANALVVADIRFVYEYGEIYMTGTGDTLKIRRLLNEYDAAPSDMVLEAVQFEL